MIGLIISFLVLTLVLPAGAFVERLNPNMPESMHGGIPCHAMGAVLFDYVVPGGPPAAILSSRIQREWVPDGWSAQDIADNSALISMLDGFSGLEKYIKAQQIEYACFLWEMDVDEYNSPVEFRARIGLPAAP